MGFWQELNKPFIGLAPMDGVTDAPMRRITARYGQPDIIYTEFVNVEYAVKKPTVLLKRLIYSNEERPVVAQLSGAQPQLFYRLAIVVCFLGFDGLDFNLGCPAKSVVSRGAGAGLIGQTKQVKEIVASVSQACRDWEKEARLSAWLEQENLITAARMIKKHCPGGDNVPVLSAKTRICSNKTKQQNWALFLVQLPLAAVAWHGRTTGQGNSGAVNWSHLRQVGSTTQSSDQLFIINGGLKDRKEAVDHCLEIGADGALIGQAALGNPWVFTEDQPDKRQRLQVMLEQARLFVRLFGEEKFVQMRKHFAWYPREFYRANQLKQQLLKTNSLSEVEKIVKKTLKNKDK